MNCVKLEFFVPSAEFLDITKILDDLGVAYTKEHKSNHMLELKLALEDFNLLKLSMPTNFQFAKMLETENNYLVVDLERYYNKHGFKK